MESGTMKLRHILTINRMMYHHHLLSLDDNEKIKQMYEKPKEARTKGDCYDLPCKDFKFVEKKTDEKEIK